MFSFQPDTNGKSEVTESLMTHEKFEGERTLMRIHIGESDKWHGKPLHEAIVEMLRKDGFSGATVLRGVGGYGGSSVYHTDKLLRLSQGLPIILEVIESLERIEKSLPRLAELCEGGSISRATPRRRGGQTTHPLQRLEPRNRHSRAARIPGPHRRRPGMARRHRRHRRRALQLHKACRRPLHRSLEAQKATRRIWLRLHRPCDGVLRLRNAG